MPDLPIKSGKQILSVVNLRLSSTNVVNAQSTVKVFSLSLENHSSNLKIIILWAKHSSSTLKIIIIIITAKHDSSTHN